MKGKIIPPSGRKRLTARNYTPTKTGKVEYLNVWINTESVQLPKDFEKLEDDTIIDMKIVVTDITAKIRDVTFGSKSLRFGGNALATFTDGIIYNKQGILIKIKGRMEPYTYFNRI